ncbi:MAG: hypothetical protein ACE14V_07030 [bacterium]
MPVSRLIPGIVIVFCLSLIISPFAIASSATPHIILTRPGLSWGIDMSIPGYTLDKKIYDPNEDKSYFVVSNKKDETVISGFLEKAQPGFDVKTWRDLYWNGLQQQASESRDNVVKRASGDKAYLEYLIKQANGIIVNQQHRFVFFYRSPYWAYIHISKLHYTAADAGLIQSLENNIGMNSITELQDVMLSLPIPNYGNLVMPVPRDWFGQFNAEGNKLGYNLNIVPPNSGMEILVTAFGPASGTLMPTPARMKQMVIKQSKEMLETAIELELKVEEFKGPKAVGYYFSCTDKAPKPNEYKFATQGMAQTGNIMFTFTILANERNISIINKTLQMLAAAEQQQ